jgi:RNA polymerase sigma-70 factor (ECF subfamily)
VTSVTAGRTFEGLWRRHRGEIAAYLRRLLGNENDAEDVGQETWLRVHRAFGRLPPDANSRAWVYRIATNRALTALRGRARRKREAADVDLDALAGRGPDFDGAAMLRAVTAAVARLPPKQRAALVARRFHDLDYAEIGAALGCSPTAARANVYQAIRTLKQRLELSHDES